MSLVFIFLGYMLKGSADIFQIIGFSFLFLLGVMLIPGTPGNLEYTTGTEISETETGFTATDITESYSDFIFGFFLSTAALFGFINVYISRKPSGGFGNND